MGSSYRRDGVAAVGISDGDHCMTSGSEIEALKRRLVEAERNLRLIRERKSEFVQGTDISLQLIRDEGRVERKSKCYLRGMAQ